MNRLLDIILHYGSRAILSVNNHIKANSKNLDKRNVKSYRATPLITFRQLTVRVIAAPGADFRTERLPRLHKDTIDKLLDLFQKLFDNIHQALTSAKNVSHP